MPCQRLPCASVSVRYGTLGDPFWLLPGARVLAGVLLAVALVELYHSQMVPPWLIRSPWLYNGGGTGARTLLGAVASSTIGAAGTVFSIAIASLSLAAGQIDRGCSTPSRATGATRRRSVPF